MYNQLNTGIHPYITILIFIIFAFLLSFIIIFASYLLAVQQPDAEKISAYECGFQPQGDARDKFEIRFFLVGILFIIFDLEISLIMPSALVLGQLPLYG